MKKFLNVLMLVLGCVGMVLSGIQLVMAVRYGELGRVVFYAAGVLVSVDMLVVAIFGLRGRGSGDDKGELA